MGCSSNFLRTISVIFSLLKNFFINFSYCFGLYLFTFAYLMLMVDSKMSHTKTNTSFSFSRCRFFNLGQTTGIIASLVHTLTPSRTLN